MYTGVRVRFAPMVPRVLHPPTRRSGPKNARTIGNGVERYFWKGLPIALGGIARPTKPASTIMVKMNGMLCTIVGGSS